MCPTWGQYIAVGLMFDRQMFAFPSRSACLSDREDPVFVCVGYQPDEYVGV